MILLDVARPYLLLAAGAFAAGFVSYFALAPSTPAAAHEMATPTPAVLATPVADEWNVPKRI